MTNEVTKEQALSALEDLDDFARMDVGVNAAGAIILLKRFIEQGTELNTTDDGIDCNSAAYKATTGKFEFDKHLGWVMVPNSTERNATMDKIIDHVHNSGKFEIDASHARIAAAMEKRLLE